MRPTQAEIETTEDLRGLFNEVVADLRHANDLRLEAKLRIKLRAVEIGLRVIEISNLEQRIAALEEQAQGARKDRESPRSKRTVPAKLRPTYRLIPSRSPGR
jgi:hypothetical protein